MSFRTVILEHPCRCQYESGYLVVRKEDGTAKIHLSEISAIIMHTQQAYISAYLLAELVRHKISFVVSDEKQNPSGQFLPLYGAHNTAKRAREQLEWTEPSKKRLWKRIVEEKILRQAELLQQQGCEAHAILTQCASEIKSGDSTNREAHAARVYFLSLFGPDFSRDDDIAINAALNYGYSILLSMVNREIVSRGYMTHMGIFHHSEFNQFNLASDFMEPFRPVVDKLVLEYLGASFDSDTKHILANLANVNLRYQEGIYKLASVVSLFIQDCFHVLAKEKDISDVSGFYLS